MIAQAYKRCWAPNRSSAKYPSGAPPAGPRSATTTCSTTRWATRLPCPASFTAACRDLLEHTDPVALHGYTPTLTLPEVRAAVAESSTAALAWTTPLRTSL